MTETPLIVKGPFQKGGSKVGSNLEFYTTEDATTDAETDLQSQSIPTQDDEDSILAPLQGKRSFRWKGRIIGNYALREGFGSNPRDALVNWLIEGESLVSSEQGIGYEVVDKPRNRTFSPQGSSTGVLIESFDWTYETGQNVSAEWNLSGQVTEGMQKAKKREAYIDSELKSQKDISVDALEVKETEFSIPLGDLSSRSYNRSISLDVTQKIHNTDVPTTGLAQSGVEGELQLDGQLTRKDVGSLKSTARNIIDKLHGVGVTFKDSLTGRSFSGAVSDSSTTIEKGRPNILDYRIEIGVGVKASNQDNNN